MWKIGCLLTNGSMPEKMGALQGPPFYFREVVLAELLKFLVTI